MQELDFFIQKVNGSLDDVESFTYSLADLGSYVVACDVAGVIEKQINALSAPHGGLFVYGPTGTIFQNGDQMPLEAPMEKDGEKRYDIVRLHGQLHFVCWLTDPETGDFKAAREVLPLRTSQDETGRLTQEFRVMLEKIDLLIYENYEKQLSLQEMRYQMLQAQINPHFLNNTLNTVAWMVKAGRNSDANKVIVELGRLLRAALSQNAYASVWK